MRALCRCLLVFFCLAFCPALLVPARALADNWKPVIYNEGLPSHLVAVDKNRRAFFFFEKKSPLKLRYQFPCVTGQLAGDKQEVNDLRTPEGVYFVEYKIASGLDFKEYGGIAYTLNYPNPVDRLRGKTGHGIWIHSKGYGLVPTRGCVAIGLEDIDTVGPNLVPGTAVVLAEHLDETAIPRKDTGTARKLRRLMQSWSEAWAARSPKMFEYYDAAAYSKATQSFLAFRQNKERLFKILDFIKIYNREIHALQGPGYWVTWSEQFYTASNLSTEGVRRLYWQEGADKKFRIVGMEWLPRDLGMRADYQKGRLVASTVPMAATGEDLSEAPTAPPLDMPESEAEARAAEKQKLVAANSEPLVPRHKPAPVPAEINWGTAPVMGRLPEPRQEATGAGPAQAQEAQKALEAEAARKAEEEAARLAAEKAAAEAEARRLAEAEAARKAEEEAARLAAEKAAAEAEARRLAEAEAARKAAEEAARPLELTPALRQKLTAQVQQWNRTFAARSEQLAAFYDQKQYNQVPDVPRGQSYKTMFAGLKRQMREPWLQVISRAPRLEVQGKLAVSHSDQLMVSPRGMEQGTRTHWWQVQDDGSFRIVASAFKNGETGLAGHYLEEVSALASADLERWRQAWEQGRIDDYMACYTSDARQQGRYGARNIRQQKEGLWSRVKPTLVQLTGLRLAMDKKGLRADMNQVYADSAGRSDRGTKTLLLRFDGSHWRIAREDWVAHPTEAAGAGN